MPAVKSRKHQPAPRPIVFVIGHQRPDSDAAVSALVAARLRQQLDPTHDYQPVLLGEPGPQTRWLFEQARTPLPPVRGDLRFTVGERMKRDVTCVRETDHLAEACNLLHTTAGSLVPVIGDHGLLTGILSDRLPQSRHFYNFNTEDYLGWLLFLPDIISALHLRPVRRNLAPAPSGPGAFRIGSCTEETARRTWTTDDVILTGPRPELLAVAAEKGVRAVLLADCEFDEARLCAKPHRNLPVWHFAGTLMGLIAQLPMAIPVAVLMAREFPTLNARQTLAEVHDLVTRSPHALPVVDETGRLIGTLSKVDLLDEQKRQVILVDHFEKNQSAAGIEQAEILEIIDHHRVGNLETFHPVRVDCRPVGSTASIIAAQYAEAGLRPTPAEAMLLLGALVSDTLLLTSPTATPGDIALANGLARRARVDLQKFGREVLRQNDELATAHPDTLVSRDLKEFQHGSIIFAAAQIETVDLGILTDQRREEIMASLNAARSRMGSTFAVLMITDVFRSESLLLISDPNPRRAVALIGSSPAGKRVPGMVSRKKQLVPMLFNGLDAWLANGGKS